MSINPHKRTCSAVCTNGHPCRAWALIDSDPPLCSAHAARSLGAGAPQGNRNAMKHGLYALSMNPTEIANLHVIKSATAVHELLLARVALRRLSSYLANDDLPLAESLAILPVMSTMLRTIAYLLGNIDESSIDWDQVLDEVGKDWQIDI